MNKITSFMGLLLMLPLLVFGGDLRVSQMDKTIQLNEDFGFRMSMRDDNQFEKKGTDLLLTLDKPSIPYVIQKNGQKYYHELVFSKVGLFKKQITAAERSTVQQIAQEVLDNPLWSTNNQQTSSRFEITQGKHVFSGAYYYYNDAKQRILSKKINDFFVDQVKNIDSYEPIKAFSIRHEVVGTGGGMGS